MKRSFKLLLSVLTLSLCIGSLSGCKDKNKLYQAKGVVTNIDADRYGDSIYSVRVLADGDTLLLTVWNCDFTNGIMLDGDSVDVSYTKANGDTLIARTLRVIPKPGKEVDLDTLKDKPLLTR